MSLEDSKNVKSDEDQNVIQKVDKSRRSFAKAGVVTPILMGFASRPAWATMANCSFGQALSGNLSQHAATCDSDTPSTVSPGLYHGDGGGAKWEEYGVGSYRTTTFISVFIKDPKVEVQIDVGGVTTWINHNSSTPPTLEQVIKATGSTVRFQNGSSSVPSGSANAVTGHYIAAYLNANSPYLIFPFTASQIQNDWGVWALLPTLENIQAGELNALQVNQFINFYN